MSLVLFYWETLPPVPPPTSAPPIVVPPGAGSGKGRGREYALDPDYWDIREKMLQGKIPQPEIPAPSLPNSYYTELQTKLDLLLIAKQQYQSKLQTATTSDAIVEAAKYLKQISISSLEIARKLNRRP